MPELSANISLSGSGNPRNDKLHGVNLYYHAYSYFPYEKELARREICHVAGVPNYSETARCVWLPDSVDKEKLRALTYMAEIGDSKARFSTDQHAL